MGKRDLILIVGLACSGKTTLAQKFAAEGHECVHSDNLRYSDNKWTRRPLTDYRRCVDEALHSARQRVADQNSVVFESTFLDMNDPEDSRRIILTELLPQAHTLIVIHSEDRFTCIARLIDRCIGLANGTLPGGSCPVTSLNRAHLLNKFILHFDTIKNALADFRTLAQKERGLKIVDTLFGQDLKKLSF